MVCGQFSLQMTSCSTLVAGTNVNLNVIIMVSTVTQVLIGEERNVVAWCIEFHNGRVVATSSLLNHNYYNNNMVKKEEKIYYFLLLFHNHDDIVPISM